MSLILSMLLAAPLAFAQDVVMQTGETTGTVVVGGTCTPRSKTCLVFQNDNAAGYPIEIVSVSYDSNAGHIVVESPPVIGAHLQCIIPPDGRACAPVLAPGQVASMQLPAPPTPGQLVSVQLRAWDPPGSEVELPRTTIDLRGVPVTLIGDPVAAVQKSAVVVQTVTVTVGQASNFINWRKGS